MGGGPRMHRIRCARGSPAPLLAHPIFHFRRLPGVFSVPQRCRRSPNRGTRDSSRLPTGRLTDTAGPCRNSHCQGVGITASQWDGRGGDLLDQRRHWQEAQRSQGATRAGSGCVLHRHEYAVRRAALRVERRLGVEPRACPAVVRACRRPVVPTGDAADTADASRGRLTNSASLRSSRSDMHTTIAYDERRA